MITTKRVAAAVAVSLALALPCALTAGASTPTAGRSSMERHGTRGLRVHLVYLVAKGHRDRHYDTDGTLARAADQMQAWFRRETGGRELRLDTYLLRGKRVPDITFVRSQRSSYSCHIATPTVQQPVDSHCYTELVDTETTGPSTRPVDLVLADLASAGLQDPNVRYLVVVEGSASIICGMSKEPENTDRDPTHVGHVAAVFLGESTCPDDDPGAGGEVSWEMTHEYLHNDGAVPMGALHGCPPDFNHVCTAGLGAGSPITDAYDPERFDIMYPTPGVPLTAAHLDAGHVDYYGTKVGLRDVANSPYFTAKP